MGRQPLQSGDGHVPRGQGDGAAFNVIDTNISRSSSGREAPSLPRLERSADFAVRERGLLPAGPIGSALAAGRRRTACSWRRAWDTAAEEKVRTFDALGALERWVEQGRRRTRSRLRTRRMDTWIARVRVPVSAGGEIQGQRKHRRCTELHLCGAVIVQPATGVSRAPDTSSPTIRHRSVSRRRTASSLPL